MRLSFKAKYLSIVFALAATSPMLYAGPNLSGFKAVLEKIDLHTEFNSDFSAEYTEITVHPGLQPSFVQHDVFRRDKDNAMAIIMLAPDSKRGQGYLNLGSNFWFYDPNSRLFTHASLKESFQGTEATMNDFFRPSWAADYALTGVQDGRLGVYPVYILELEGTNNEVTFPYKKIWVRKDIDIVLKEEDYSLSKRLMRTVYYPHYMKIGTHYVADKTLMVDDLNVGVKTQMTLSSISLAPLPDYTFTKAYLEQVNR